MFPSRIQKLLRLPTFFLFLGMLIFGSFCTGMFHSASMHEMAQDGTSELTQANPPCCGSTYLTRMTLHDSLFFSESHSLRDMLALIGLALAFGLWRKMRADAKVAQKLSSKIRWLFGKNPDLLLFDPLKLAFAQGVLHPKIY